MIVETVLMFGALNIIFETVLLGLLPPKLRLRILGSKVLSGLVHFLFLIGNLFIHWGTLIGSMASILAFCCSILTIQATKLLWGYIDGNRYRRGLIAYKAAELV